MLVFFCLLFIAFFARAAQAQNSEYLKVRVVPPVYETIVDSVVIVPALNANLDTSNYFTQMEIVLLKEPTQFWVKNSESTLCVVHTAPEYIEVERRFYPFKNILDTENAEAVIPAQIKIIERKVLVRSGRLDKLSADAPTEESELVIKIRVQDWVYWQNFIDSCQYDEANSL